jgi:hypothetical protein
MTDIIQWKDYFSHYTVIERGSPGKGYLEQHNLMLTAFQEGLADHIVLLRGELDEILLNGKDIFDNLVVYPYDVVSLDYSGGLLYKNGAGRSRRIESISKLIEGQANNNQNFLLFIWCNMDFNDQGEINRVFQDINRELGKMGIDANPSVQAYKNHSLLEARLKVYVPFIIHSISTKWYQIEYNKPVFYLGNKDTRMMHFSFWMKRTTKYVAGKPDQSALIDIMNLPAFNCVDGNLTEHDFKIPKIII